jgi:Tol biopolymer transport system component
MTGKSRPLTLRLISYLGLGIFLTGLLSWPTMADAQYFGRNKVQYDKFKFQVMKTKHFDIYFYPEEKTAVEMAARMAERWYKRLSRIFSHELKGKQPLVLYANQPHFQQTTVIPDIMGEGTGGVTESFKRRIVLPMGGSLAETDHVIGHELVHAFQYDLASQGGQQYSPSAATQMTLPLWFIEGMAEYLSIGPIDPHTAMWMRDAVKNKKIPEIKKLEDTYRYFPYRYGQALWAYICGRFGDMTIGRMMKTAARAREFQLVMEKTLSIPLKQLSADWKKALEQEYKPVLEATLAPSAVGRRVIAGSEEDRYNVSPAVSPDGRQFVFLSSRDLFSIEMYISETATGKVKSKLTKTAVNPEYQSLQFIYSAGSWSDDGRRFVFGAISKGKPILVVMDGQSQDVIREIEVPELGEILNPTWAPDGQAIAFSALSHGFTDLYIYDLKTSKLKRLTDDPFADIHPSWSPDGKYIAFVTDRFTTQLANLSYGEYQVALINPQNSEVTPVNSFKDSKSTNPQWAADSKGIYFLSDQGGITNIYRVEVETGQLFQVTRLQTGVSGITDLSPAISVARKTGQLVYSVYESGNYAIYSLETSEQLAGKPVDASLAQLRAASLPPKERGASEVLGLLKNPFFGLPESSQLQVSDYKPKLSLDYVSPPQLAVGADRYGTYAGGGIALYWGDMLGYHTLATMVQTSNRLQDTAALVGYINSQSRWNWGAYAQRIPYIYGGYYASLGTVFNEPAYVEEEYVFRQINYDLGIFTYYPFNPLRRFEISASVDYIDFDYDIYTRAYSLYDNSLLLNEKESLPAPKGIYFGNLTTALVYDSSIFGATSPLIGQSYRLEVSPTIGNVTFYSLLADYRKYIMPVRPFTLAFRMLHYGRYGKDADDERLYPVFIGYDGLVRGYDYYSFSANELYGTNSTAGNLFGSKMIVANLELRFPLFRVLGLGSGYYGVFPIEFVSFYDYGVAWWEDESPSIFGGSHHSVSSAGVGIRVNAFGYVIVGLNAVRPFDRPEKNWVFQLSLMPGF